MNTCSARTGAPPSSGTSGRRSFRPPATTAIRRRSSIRSPAQSTRKVVAYWHDHYDLTAILKRDWSTLGPKLEGKLHFAVGDGDTYFLNNAVHLLQKQLDATRNPHSDATFQYGPGMPHCYTGGPSEYTMQQNNADWTAARVAADGGAHAGNGAGRRRYEILAILSEKKLQRRSLEYIPVSGTH